jgi:hypothetical protein
MKSIKTIISVLFAVGTISLIVYDTQTRKSIASERHFSHQDSIEQQLKK